VGSCQAETAVALTADKKVWTWGKYTSGELGRSGENRTPGLVSTLTNVNVVAIAGGQFFTLAVTSNGQVFAWGSNFYGQLATNGPTEIDTPYKVAGLSNAVWVSASVGGYHSMAVTVDGGTNRHWGWGRNADGQVGNGTTDDQYAPAPLQFCTRCQRCVQLGTNGVFTAQCNGTLTLYFNDEQGYFGDNSGSYTVSFDGLSTNVNVLANNANGVAVGAITNGGVYSYSASGFCSHDPQLPATDANGNPTNGTVSCSSINITNAICPAATCFSLVGKVQ
jgi:alpha-tubulin suppressor-like RCC1 family protein